MTLLESLEKGLSSERAQKICLGSLGQKGTTCRYIQLSANWSCLKNGEFHAKVNKRIISVGMGDNCPGFMVQTILDHKAEFQGKKVFFQCTDHDKSDETTLGDIQLDNEKILCFKGGDQKEFWNIDVSNLKIEINKENKSIAFSMINDPADSGDTLTIFI